MTGTVGAGLGSVPELDVNDLIELSFSLDTSQADASFVLRDRGLGAGVQLTNFSFHFAVSDLYIAADEKVFMDFPGLTAGGVFGGQTISPRSTIYDGTINFSDQAGHLFVFDTGAMLSVITAQQFFASSNPFADILLTLDGKKQFAVNGIEGEWGRIALDVKSLSVHAVPEPATTWLAIIGLLAMLGLRRPRVAINT
jgi:hypothetical protein